MLIGISSLTFSKHVYSFPPTHLLTYTLTPYFSKCASVLSLLLPQSKVYHPFSSSNKSLRSHIQFLSYCPQWLGPPWSQCKPPSCLFWSCNGLVFNLILHVAYKMICFNVTQIMLPFCLKSYRASDHRVKSKVHCGLQSFSWSSWCLTLLP